MKNLFRPAGAEHIFGTFLLGPLFEPGKGLMKAIEDFIPTMHPVAVVHDKVVGSLMSRGVPFHVANVPTMPLAYVAGTAGAIAQTVVDVV